MNRIKQNNIFIAGGGTGGHLFPALTIGDYLKKDGINTIINLLKNITIM